jgi:hypothetical protein
VAGQICDKASVAKRTAPFQNMRATRETAFADSFPIQAVTAWIGNTVDVATTHYLMTTRKHIDKAAGLDARESPADPAEKTQHTAAPTCGAKQETRKPREKQTSPEANAPSSTPTGSRTACGFPGENLGNESSRCRIRCSR